MFVRTGECVCARNSKSASALARDCHLVGADLGPFRPVGFVVVCKTRVKVNSAFPLESPNRKPFAAAQGWKHSGSVMHVTSALNQDWRSP